MEKSRQQLSERNQQLSDLRQKITRLERLPPASPATLPAVPSLSEADRQTLQNLASTFRNLWHFSPSELALAEKLRLANQRAKKSQQLVNRTRQRQQELQQQLISLRDRYTALLRRDATGQQATAQQQAELEQQIAGLNHTKQQLADSLLRSKAAEAQLDSVLAQQKSSSSSASKASAALLAEKNSAEEKLKALQARLDEVLAQQKSSSSSASKASAALLAEKNSAEEKLKALQARLDEVLAQQQVKQSVAVKPGVAELTAAQLRQKATREAYAIGFSMGQEILQVQAENHNWSAVDNDRRVVLAGIVDAFKNTAKIPLADMEKIIASVATQLNSGREKFMNRLDKSTKNFVKAFINDKKTHKSKLGFWYQIGYIGDTPISANTSIDVVVKESLASGKVIEDMDAKGIVLTQPLSAFPPIFQEALSKIKNHGSVTIVVPPNLAYGEKGYPPKVPPNATMVYDIRIAESYPENKKKNASPEKKVLPGNPAPESKRSQ
ncbi:FKBP-type peptidyl-prolyl cis-trans isomerase [Erwinia sp. B116]|uniref:FKBP-type peptidyl-prolyl cis-trans isomerase n=1 Tax=Erwinia sp. B116 TaxID=1561024 RepID=UPI00130441BA|nr:FKBP-type peptidyl-prolyl cis-trans isomerase [Erwinia sp. B116]